MLGNADVFDLRSALAATSWDQQLSDLGNFLQLSTQSGNAFVSIDPTGLAGGSVFTVAQLNGAGSLTLANFLTHALVA